MSPRDFVFWLQGHMEMNDPEKITVEQVEMIKSHIDLTLLELSKKKLLTPQPSPQMPGNIVNTTLNLTC